MSNYRSEITFNAIALIIVGIVLVTSWTLRTSESPIMWDAGENLIMMLNLDRHGVMSLQNDPPFTPTMYREPLPVLQGQFSIWVVDALFGPSDQAFYFRGERARALKLLQNLPWLTVLSIATFLFCRELRLSFAICLVGVLLLNGIVLWGNTAQSMVDSLYSEAGASALLSLASLLLLTGNRRRTMWRIAAAGVCFGLLMLVKAAYLYLIIGMLVVIPATALLARHPLISAARQAIVLAAVAILVASPWMFRNYRDFGHFAISLRGGEVLYDRAVANEMTLDEYLGAYYFYAPYPLNGALRRILGFSNDDVDEGGRLQRINEGGTSRFFYRDYFAEVNGRPQDAVTYMHRAGAEHVLLRNQLQAAGDIHASVTADQMLRRRALSMMLHHPLREIALIPMNLWRGALLAFPILIVSLVYSIRQKRFDLAVAILPAAGSLLFYATFAHLEPRYAIPTYSIVVCLLLTLAASCYRRKAVEANS